MLCKKKKKRNYRVSWSLFKIKYRRRLTRVDILLFRLCSWSDSPCLIVSHIAFTILLTTMARHIVLRFENWKNVLTRTPRWMVSSSWHQCEPNVSIIPAFRESAFGSHPTSFCQNAVSFTFGTYRREGENQRHHLSRSVFNKSDGDCFSVINLLAFDVFSLHTHTHTHTHTRAHARTHARTHTYAVIESGRS